MNIYATLMIITTYGMDNQPIHRTVESFRFQSPHARLMAQQSVRTALSYESGVSVSFADFECWENQEFRG